MQPAPPRNEGSAVPVRRKRGGWRFGLTLTALIVGIAGLAASAAGVSAQLLPRRLSARQQQEIMAWEILRRWRTEQAGKIFPAVITYQLPGAALGAASALPLAAYRVAISREASCGVGSDLAAARILAAGRCAAMLRATYADGTDSMLVTVGVAVMPDAAAATAAARQLSARQLLHPGSGVRAAAFRYTLARSFDDRQRQLSWTVSAGPYLILSTAGYVDGRPHVRLSSDPYLDQEMTSFADGVAAAVGGPLSARPPVPRCPGAPGC